MMTVIYVMFAIAIVSLCIVASVSDLCTGMVYNRILAVFLVLAVILDCIYYGFFERDYLLDFAINFLVTVCICLSLFYTHSLAGGDCKLLIVLSLLYPTSACINYNGCVVTFFFVIAFAVMYGYIYLLMTSLLNLLTDKTHIEKGYVVKSIKGFALNYFKAMVYISLLTIFFYILTLGGLEIPEAWMSGIYFVVACLVGRSTKFKRWKLVIPALILVLAFSLGFKVIPFSLHPQSYVFVAVLMMCQMTIRTNLYKEIPLEFLRKGMILSVASSMLFQNSRVRGLPEISTEDLRSRLTEEEINSIIRWGEGKKVTSVVIIKKIPFAIFISLGVLSYYILWRQF